MKCQSKKIHPNTEFLPLKKTLDFVWASCGCPWCSDLTFFTLGKTRPCSQLQVGLSQSYYWNSVHGSSSL